MTKNLYKISQIYRKLAYKFEKDRQQGIDVIPRRQQLWHVLTNSMPVVYGQDWDVDFNECSKIRERRRKQNRRIKNWIQMLFDSYEPQKLFFLTFNFSNESLLLKERTRRSHVMNFLNKYCLNYVGNIDFGDSTHREHYHAVVASDGFDLKDYEGGFVYYERIRSPNSDRLAKYINKLTNHATKLSAGRVFRKRGFVEIDNLPF